MLVIGKVVFFSNENLQEDNGSIGAPDEIQKSTKPHHTRNQFKHTHKSRAVQEEDVGHDDDGEIETHYLEDGD